MASQRDRPTLAHALAIAKALDTTVEALFAPENEEAPATRERPGA